MVDMPVTRSTQAARPTPLSSCEGLLELTNASTGDTRPVPIAIQGLSPGISGPLDFGKRVIRAYPKNDHGHGYTMVYPAARHIDVTTEWSFSRYAEAQELYRIHQAFTITLEELLASELWKVYIQDCKPNIGEAGRCLTAEVVRGISFCREQLVGDMADLLYPTQEDIRVRAQLGLIRLYLVASDCLIRYNGPHSRDTSITVRVHHDTRTPTPYPFVQAAWVPDSIVFDDLDETQLPREGQEFTIVPRYQCNSAFASTRFPANVKYSIGSQYTSLSWLTWDDRLAGFKGIVPMYSIALSGDYSESLFACNGTICIDVKAVIVEDNGSSVHFKRTVRACLTLNVLSWDDAFGPSPYQIPEPDPAQYSFSAQRVDRVPPSGYVVSGDTHLSSQVYDDRQYMLSNERIGGPIPSNAEPEVNATTKTLNLAQQHAHLAARYADSSASSYIPDYALDNRTSSFGCTSHQNAPRLPHLEGRAAVQTQFLESSSNIGFPNLPPPAIRLGSSQTFDDTSQDRARIDSSLFTPTHHDCRSGNSVSRMDLILQDRPTSQCLAEVPTVKFPRPQVPMEDGRGDPGCLDTAQDSVRPSIDMNNGAESVRIEGGSCQRNARSSLSKASALKQPTENESQSRTSKSGLGMTSYNCYSPSHKDREPTFGACNIHDASIIDFLHSARRGEEDASIPMRTRRRNLRPRTDSGYRSDCDMIGNEAQLLHILADPIQSPQSVPTSPDSFSNMSPTATDPGAKDHESCECEYGEDDATKTHTSYPTIYLPENSVSVHSWQSSETLSHAALGNLELTGQDHHQRLCHAKNWHELCEFESGDKVKKPEAAEAGTRLSEDETKAMDEAIERSLEDMAESFNGVFLNDDDELASGDETSANDEP